MKLWTLALLLQSAVTFAAIPKNSTSLEQILAQKSSDKFAKLRDLGPQVYADLKQIAFNEDRALGTRWQAFMAMAKLGDKDAMPEIDQALNSHEWFLKNAALKVVVLFDETKAYSAAVKSLDDSALVVRSQAVKTLAKVKNEKCVPRLWQELYSKENYLKNQSLWIRKDIVNVLAELSPKGSEEKFIKVLNDSDSTLFDPAIRGLERLTGVKLGNAEMPGVYKRYLWKKWFENRSKEKSS